jgi:uncharacterized protein (TIGR03435 family)
MRNALGAALAAALSIGVSAQTPGPSAAGDPPRYVASVKRSSPDAVGPRLMMQPGTFNGSAVRVRMLIRQAFQLQDFQIAGGPDWIASAPYDVVARLEGPPSPPMMAAMLRAVLADRFKLRTRMETREMPVFALVRAHDDGRLGPGLKPSTMDCAAAVAAARAGGPQPPIGPGGCGGRGGAGMYTTGGTPIFQLVTTLSQQLGRTVIDRTGLTGAFDIDLRWTPTSGQLPPGPPPPGVSMPPFDADGPPLVTALHEQLGLKLEAQRGEVSVLVIESIERPTDD